jgi:hypothetical protein
MGRGIMTALGNVIPPVIILTDFAIRSGVLGVKEDLGTFIEGNALSASLQPRTLGTGSQMLKY